MIAVNPQYSQNCAGSAQGRGAVRITEDNRTVLVGLRAGHPTLQPQQQSKGGTAGQGQHAERGRIGIPGDREHPGNGERADHRTDLVQRLVHGETAASAGHTGRVRQQGVFGGAAHSFPDSLGDDQRARHPQGARDAKQRNRYHRQGVAGDGPGPKPSASIGQWPRHQPQAQGGGLTDAGDDSDHQSGRSQRSQQRAGDRTGPFIHDVGEQADHPEHCDESPRAQCRTGGADAAQRDITVRTHQMLGGVRTPGLG